MEPGAHSPLAAWESFYVIVGSSAAALTGLQFVVMALIMDSKRAGDSAATAAFSTPTVVHFCVALLVAAIGCAPWAGLVPAAWSIGLAGAFGVVYAGVVLRRTVRQAAYRPVLEDWIWHITLPFVAYGSLAIGAIMLPGSQRAEYVIAAATLMLVFVGIHNAWDSVTYITIDMRQLPTPTDTP